MFTNLNKVFKKLCENGDSVEKIRDEIQKALNLTWENNDQKTKEYREKIFPNGKPTIEKFLKKLTQMAREK